VTAARPEEIAAADAGVAPARVVVIFTGGTISMTVDPAAGGARPALDGASLLASADVVGTVDITTVDLGRTPASHFTFDDLLRIVGTAREALASDPRAAGAVVVQGTDTMDEAAFTYDLVWPDARPLVVTGAMRTSDAPGADGPANLRDALAVSASPDFRGLGAVVVLNGEVHAADAVVKMHTTAMDAFGSPDAGPIGRVDGGVPRLHRRPAGRRRVTQHVGAVPPVGLVVAAIGLDGSAIDAAVAGGARGVVVEATGSGNTHPALLAAAERAMAAGVTVVLASRVPAGHVTTGYAFPGGGATWARSGAILAGRLTGPKARVALALGLAAGLDRTALASLLTDPG
jgi:L-asparaginase